MSNLISSFTEQDFYNETLILERIKEWEQRVIKLKAKLKEAKKNKDKYTIKNTKILLKNARLEIKGYQRQTLTALSKVKDEYNNLLFNVNKPIEPQKADPIPFLISELKDSNKSEISDFIEDIKYIEQKDSLMYHKMVMIGFTLLPLLRAFDLHKLASCISEAQTYIEDSEVYNELQDNEITQILRVIQKGLTATMVLSTGNAETKENFLSYCKFGCGF